MKNIVYAFKQVFRLRTTNIVKLISLALGITISGLLMCRVAWEQSYDNFWSDTDNLRYLEINWQMVNQPVDPDSRQRQCMGPMAPEMADKLPAVRSATRFGGWSSKQFYNVGDKSYELYTLGADTSMFDVFDIEMFEGEQPKAVLSTKDGILLNRSSAEKLFPQGSAVGEQVLLDTTVYTVRGVFEDMPRNTTLPLMEAVIAGRFRDSWDGGDSYFTFMRVEPGTTNEQLDKQVNELFAPRYVDMEKNYGQKLTFYTHNIREIYKARVESVDIVMSILALALLLIAGFNFALLSVSSLATRAKEIGVHKASGAKTAGIFALIIWETVIYVILALALSAVLIWGFKPLLEQAVGLYEDVFSLGNMWAVGLVLVLIIIIAGVIPAYLFSRIPVTQVFQRFTAAKARWKQGLLFMQFTSSIFVLCFMMIIVRQYQTLVTHNLGYDHQNLVTLSLERTDETFRQTLLNELRTLSNVEDMCLTDGLPYDGLSGNGVFTPENQQFVVTSRMLGYDSAFFSVYRIPVMEGVVETHGNREVMINKDLARKLNLENAVGSVIWDSTAIKGVVRDFQLGTLHIEQQPLLLYQRNTRSSYAYLTIRLHTADRAAIDQLQTVVNRMMPKNTPQIGIYSENLKNAYSDSRMLRDGVMAASIILIIITVMGIMGYVNTETRRRSKEIAIRKIHGATSISIITMITQSLAITAIIATIIGIPSAYIIGEYWQRQFAVKAPLSIDIFIAGAAVIIVTIVVCVTLQTWRIANSNPARSIKSE